ncbi:MAG: DUF481 domain-containing protein [Candidatus Hydrogenedentota bacterium]
MHGWLPTIVAVALSAGAVAVADTLELGNGETFSGTAVRVTEGTLVFRTSLAGQMMVPMDTVAALATEKNLVITLADGRVVYGRLAHGDGGARILPLEGGAPIPITLGEVRETAALPATPGTEAETPARLDVGAEAGVRLRDGNTRRVEPLGRLSLSQGDADQRLDAELVVERDDTGRFPGYARMRTGWQTQPGVAGAYAAGTFLRNTDAALDARVQLSLGLHKRLFGDEGANTLDWRTGIAVQYEAWDTQTLHENDSRQYPDKARTEGAAEAELQLRYARAIWGGGRIENRFILYPSLTGPGDFRAQSETAVSWPVTPALQLRLNFELYYESNPPFPGLSSWESSVGAGVRFEF